MSGEQGAGRLLRGGVVAQRRKGAEVCDRSLRLGAFARGSGPDGARAAKARRFVIILCVLAPLRAALVVMGPETQRRGGL